VTRQRAHVTSAAATRNARIVLLATRDRLAAAGVESPRVDAEILLAHVLGETRSSLLSDLDRAVGEEQADELAVLVERRVRREPLAYVVGEWGFRRLTLSVDQRVLVPRPETEVLVERCLDLVAHVSEPAVLDVGTGSGAVALAIADEHAGAKVTGIDVSAGALEVAAANAARFRLDVAFVRRDLFAGLPAGPWDLVASNPPYVRPAEIDRLEPEVRDWEPRVALVAEGATEAIAEGSSAVLRRGGALVLEVADGDAVRVAGILRELGYRDVAVTRDLAGRARVVEGILA
jgi:release factor glutamine methyltransferase